MEAAGQELLDDGGEDGGDDGGFTQLVAVHALPAGVVGIVVPAQVAEQVGAAVPTLQHTEGVEEDDDEELTQLVAVHALPAGVVGIVVPAQVAEQVGAAVPTLQHTEGVEEEELLLGAAHPCSMSHDHFHDVKQ